MPRDRRALVQKLRIALERRSSPRVEMALIALCTGASGFLISFCLLRFGLERIWLRYLVAIFAAYFVFFCLLRLWLHLHGRRIRMEDAPDPSDGLDLGDALLDFRPLRPGFEGGGGQFGGAGASSALDGPRIAPAVLAESQSDAASSSDLFDADEAVAVVPLLLVAALASALVASVWVVYLAPTLLAELLIDGALVGGLYHRIRRESSGSWLFTALRNTALPFAATCLVFVLAGWFVQFMVPEADSIGDAVRYLQAHR